MFIIFGTMGMKNTARGQEPLTGQCPNCNGSLVLKKYNRWFTLFFIPVFPFQTIETFYECDRCKSAYAERIKTVLKQSKEEQEKENRQAKKLFMEALVASMTHMATVDAHFAPEEEREIDEMIAKVPDYQEFLNSIKEKVRTTGNQDNYVFNLLNKVREVLSNEAVLNLLAQSAVVLLADGKIEKAEKQLMEEYLIACGLSKDFYQVLIDKLKKIEVAAS